MRVLRILAATLAVLLIAEVSARIALTPGAVFRRVKGRDAASGRLFWMRNHGSTLGMQLSFDAWDSVRGWRLAPNVRNPHVDSTVLNTNSLGVRGTREYPYARQPAPAAWSSSAIRTPTAPMSRTARRTRTTSSRSCPPPRC